MHVIEAKNQSELARLTVQVPYLFCYGILKRGFEADLGEMGGKFIDTATIPNAQLYGIRGGVGLRFEPTDEFAVGELFEVHGSELWDDLDAMESNGFSYTRKIVDVNTTSHGSFKAWVYEHTYPGMAYDYKLEGNEY